MKPKLFLLFNHELTEKQIEDAFSQMKIEEIITLPENQKKIWKDFPVNGEEDYFLLSPFISWFKKNMEVGDYILIQGEFGATFYLVDFCLENGYIPIYAAATRSAKEHRIDDNRIEKLSEFEHMIFRKYRRWNG